MIDIELFVRLRKKQGSQTKLAQAADVSQQLIGQIETGDVRSTKAIYRIARVLSVPANLLDPDIPPPSPLEEHFAKVMELLKKLPAVEADFHIRKFEEMLQFLVNSQKSPDKSNG